MSNNEFVAHDPSARCSEGHYSPSRPPRRGGNLVEEHDRGLDLDQELLVGETGDADRGRARRVVAELRRSAALIAVPSPMWLCLM